ncbi:MAG: hypothetical protein KKA79_03185 [Nanoarchaeota archaeon]|nr:hypothetical protein [Nanoarchaeota archaeon]MCG2717659.1 hypothetical protein [Nanoarchaeota archaeon]
MAGEITGFCKESGQPIIDDKCVCPGEKEQKHCGCCGNHDFIDIGPIIPFIIHNASFYKGRLT